MFLHYSRNSSTFPYLNDFRHQHYNDKLISWTDGSAGKESTCGAGDTGSIPGLGRSPGGEIGNPLQYSCLGNPMDRGAWRGTVHGLTKSQT